MLQKKFHTPLLAAASISLIFVGGVIQNLLIIVSRACQTSGLANLFARCRDERSEYRHREGKRSKTKGKGFPKVPQLSKILETTPLLAAASISLIFVGGVIQNLLINVSRARQTSGLANLFARCRDERSEYRHREGKRSRVKGFQKWQ